MAEDLVRIFIAVPVPPDALAACQALLQGVRTTGHEQGARWVRTENLHLTVRFLGEVEADVMPDVAIAMTAAVASIRPFRITLSGAGAFPAPDRPRSLWLGIVEGGEGLADLSAALQAPLDALGWDRDDRPFRPHLTVGRTDATPRRTGAATAAALVAAARDWELSFAADRVVLYQSHLSGGPAHYLPLAEALLRG